MADSVGVTIAALLASPGVTALVGQNINPDTAGPAMPSITVSMVSDNPLPGLTRSSTTWTGRTSIQIRAPNHPTRAKINAAVRAALNNRRGTFQGARCKFWKAGSDLARFSDDGSVAEQVTDWYVSYSAAG